MHPLSLLITVLLIALVVFLIVYLWRQYVAEQKVSQQEIRQMIRDEVQNYFIGVKLKEEIEDIKSNRRVR